MMRASTLKIIGTSFITGRMLAIECNPRLHSCIVLMKNQMIEAGEAFGRALHQSDNNNNNIDDSTPACPSRDEDDESMVTPSQSQRHVIWLFNELGKLAHVSSFVEIVDIFGDIVSGKESRVKLLIVSL